jgi:acetolactate synthase-1/2/3 large subunit
MVAVMVTAGPGGTNAMTGVACAYVDSIPMLVIAGQVTSTTMVGDSGVRQVGMNELNMVAMMKPITKFAVTVKTAMDIGYVLDTAIWIANNVRKGPVFIEIPLDIQATEINPDEMFRPAVAPTIGPEIYDTMARTIQDELIRAKRSVVIVGNGVRLAGAIDEFRRIFDHLGVPIVSSWGAADIIPTDHPYYVGRCGIFGDRASNFAVQGADLILAIGTRLSVAQIGHSSHLFAPNAKKIIVDIDGAEVHRKQTVKADIGIVADAKTILSRMWRQTTPVSLRNAWTNHCQILKNKYPTTWLAPSKFGISSYAFIHQLTDQISDDAIIVTDVGFCFIPTFQTMKLRKGQRLIHSGGVSPMGWGIPAAIGAAFAGKGPVVCLTGDGGAMMNMQELQTIASHRLPMAIFLFENDGYATMKIAQNNHFKREVMAGPRSGLGFPDFVKVAKAFGITTMEFTSINVLSHAMESIFDIASQAPVIVVMHMDRDELIGPRVQAKTEDGKFVPADIADMWPHLPREEFAENMNQGVSSNVVKRFDGRGQKILGTS